MTYRDDLGAATARADALAREVQELQGQASSDRERIRRLEVLLGVARQELATLRARVLPPPREATPFGVPPAPAPPAVAPYFYLFAALVAGLALVMYAISVAWHG